MEIDIINKKENSALDRTEVKFNCIYDGEATPKILDVKSKLVALLDTKKDLIVVDSIQPHFGETKAAGYAKIYGSKDSLEGIETEHVIAKNKEPEVEEVVDDEAETSEESEEANDSEEKSEESEDSN
ncbi:30S ribosomal protein S24e [Methanobrevibacter sp. TMH8]|nr:30S ribosomal protein S24e [Methanobrevibacter sp. TMH8]MBZ9570998.1 30S ribosomal protein S24e [Methanobrevibacter sp. TMH8]